MRCAVDAGAKRHRARVNALDVRDQQASAGHRDTLPEAGRDMLQMYPAEAQKRTQFIVVPRYITACELAQHPLHHQRLGQRSRRGTAEVPSQPPKPKGQRGSGGAEPKPPQSLTSRYKRGEEIYIDSNSTASIDYPKTGQPRPN